MLRPLKLEVVFISQHIVVCHGMCFPTCAHGLVFPRDSRVLLTDPTGTLEVSVQAFGKSCNHCERNLFGLHVDTETSAVQTLHWSFSELMWPNLRVIVQGCHVISEIYFCFQPFCQGFKTPTEF